jgi:hypothetical protein
LRNGIEKEKKRKRKAMKEVRQEMMRGKTKAGEDEKSEAHVPHPPKPRVP